MDLPSNQGDLRAMVQETLALAKENHRMLRAIRRDAWWNLFGKIIFWAVIIFLPIYFYQQYLAPYLGALPSSAQFQNLLNSYKSGK